MSTRSDLPKALLLALSLALGLLALPEHARAQDDEGEEEGEEEGEDVGGADLDDLMSADPEGGDEGGEGGEGEAGEGGEEGGEEGWDDESLDEEMLDHERPPPDEEPEPAKEEVEEPIEETDSGKPLSLGLLLGYGFPLGDDPNVWGPGIGAQFGWDLGRLTLGARFVYYLGTTEEITVTSFFAAPMVVEYTANLWELGIEAGFDIEAGPVVIRPGAGLGLAAVGADDSTNVSPVISPGVAVLYDATESIYVGLDSRVQIVMADGGTFSGLVFLLSGGMRF